MTKECPRVIKIDDTEYIRKDSIPQKPEGPRAVIVVDRGWIFAGDVMEVNGKIHLFNVIHVLRWEGCGFDGMIANPLQSCVKIKKLDVPVVIPADAEIFRLPVPRNWGLS